MTPNTRYRLKVMAVLLLSLVGTQVSSPDASLAILLAAIAAMCVPDGRPKRTRDWLDYVAIGAIGLVTVLAIVSRFVVLPEELERPLMWVLAVVLALVFGAALWNAMNFFRFVGSAFRDMRSTGRRMVEQHPELADHLNTTSVTGPRSLLVRWLLWGQPLLRRRR